MQFELDSFFHIYNRSNSKNENIFLEDENYHYFLKKFHDYLDEVFILIAYCLLPNHFHFLVKVKNIEEIQNIEIKSIDEFNISKCISQKISNFLNAYSKAFNKRFNRRGSLFQKNTKNKKIDKASYFQRIVKYIHRNPLKHRIVKNINDWIFSSYLYYIEKENNYGIDTAIVLRDFDNTEHFIKYTHLDELMEDKEFSYLLMEV